MNIEQTLSTNHLQMNSRKRSFTISKLGPDMQRWLNRQISIHVILLMFTALKTLRMEGISSLHHEGYTTNLYFVNIIQRCPFSVLLFNCSSLKLKPQDQQNKKKTSRKGRGPGVSTIFYKRIRHHQKTFKN